MLKSLDYYAGATREMISLDNARDATYQKIHNASVGHFVNPPELRALPWIKDRKFVTTAPGDALNAAIRTFATRMPKIEIQPLSESEEEYRRVERLENAMTWEFKRMNQSNSKSPHWKIVEYAMKYCAVAIETSYIPFIYSTVEKTPRVKEIMRQKNFRWTVHDPSNIHVRESDDVLECVVNTEVKSLAELIDLFGEKNKGIAQLISECENPGEYYTKWFTLYDYTDWNARVKWVSPTTKNVINRTAPVGVEIMREKRTVSFMPWVFVDNQEPILKQMVQADLWDNVNILRTMQFSKSVDMAAHPEYWIQTPDGSLRGVHIDNTNPNQPLVTAPGVNVTQLRPPAIDPQLATINAQAEQEVFRTTVAQILASVEKYAGTQNFSVVNAMLNAAVAQLSLAQMVAERAETSAMIQNFRWIKETEIPMVGFRDSAGTDAKRGEELVIKEDDFDTEYMYLSVKLNPSTVMDKQTDINNTINMVERLGMSQKMAWDYLGQDNYELSEAQKTEEALFQANVQAKAQEIMAEAQMKLQAKAQALQQGGGAGQPAPNPENAAGRSQFAGAEGMTPGGGGNTMPGQGREQLTGRSASGQEIA